VRRGGSILLIDDVYTDGLTTATIVDALKQKFPDGTVDVTIATLRIMAKQNNMNRDLIESWR
jgi:predicted amidophosphoribosyltransferase